MNQRKALICLMAIMAAAVPGHANEAEDSFKLLFGAKYDQAVASAPLADDLSLASEMFDAAKTLTSSPAMLTLLCDRAFALGSKDPEGYDTAAGAMALLAEHVPSRVADANEKLIDIQQKSFVRAKPDKRTAAGEALIATLVAQGDGLVSKSEANSAIALYRRAATVAAQIRSPSIEVLKGKLEAAQTVERLEKQVALLRSKVLENAGDHESAEQLVKLLIVDMDNPSLAQQYVHHVKDADLKKHMVTAVKPIDDLPQADAQSLGIWYRAQAGHAREPQVKASALSRCAQCFERFLALHTVDDLTRRTVALTLEDVKKSLAALEESGVPASAAAASKVIRLFNGKDLTGWRQVEGPSGNWSAGRALIDPTTPTRFRTSTGTDLINLGNQGKTSLATEASFGDCVLELEFMLSQGCNSGIFLMSQYEIQIWDNTNQKVRPEQVMGAIYNQTAPRVNAARQAGQWQKLVIDFRAPRFDKSGNKTANARFVKVLLNGQLLHQNVEVKAATNPAYANREAPTAPLLLQGTPSPIAFREINIKPLSQ